MFDLHLTPKCDANLFTCLMPQEDPYGMLMPIIIVVLSTDECKLERRPRHDDLKIHNNFGIELGVRDCIELFM